MYRINTLNKIDPRGLEEFTNKYLIDTDEVSEAIILRSYKMHDYDFPAELLAVARAGAGVNNIPLDVCTERGIVVFNTPGANANGVKEAVLTGMLLACRDVLGAIDWIKTADTSNMDLVKLVEKNKSNFKGGEIKGKTLAVIGLGAIGVLVANMAVSLGMKVKGYDPYILDKNRASIDGAVEISDELYEIYEQADFISLHLPLLDDTKGFINEEALVNFKEGAVLLNFARGELVDDKDLIKALSDGKVRKYVTDFPNANLVGVENVIPIPHLGASTPESETNCAIMAARQLRNFLENANIENSVNAPACSLGTFASNQRISVLAREGVKSEIANFLIKAKAQATNTYKGIFYGIYDFEDALFEEELKEIEGIDGVLRLRAIYKNKRRNNG